VILSELGGVGGSADQHTDETGPATLARLNYPTSVTGDAYGNIFVVDVNVNGIHMVSKTSNIITTFNGTLSDRRGINVYLHNLF
jgi:hypothetical protein